MEIWWAMSRSEYQRESIKEKKMASMEAATLDYEVGSAANSRNLVLEDWACVTPALDCLPAPISFT